MQQPVALDVNVAPTGTQTSIYIWFAWRDSDVITEILCDIRQRSNHCSKKSSSLMQRSSLHQASIA